MRLCSPGWRQKIHYTCFCFWVLFWVVRWKPNWIYASDVLACPITWLLSILPGQRIVYHEHDSPGPPESVLAYFYSYARRKVAQRVAVCALPNERRAKVFAEQTGRSDVLCIWNCPRCEEVGRPQPVSKGHTFWLLYHGSVVPQRLPTTVITAMADLPDCFRLRVVGYETAGHIGYLKQLHYEAQRVGVAHRLEIRQAVPRYELLRICRTCHVGLAFVPRRSADVNFQGMTGASNKPFDYLACGLALLVSDLSEWCRMYVEPGYALSCNPEDPQSITAALRWFLEHPNETRAMGERGRQRILTDWNYEMQFHAVGRRLEGVKS